MKNAEITILFRQLATMIDAGIPLVKSLSALESQTADKTIKTMLHTIRTDVESGKSFSKALENQDKVVSPFVSSMVYAGEHGVGLSAALTRIAAQLETDAQLQGKIKHVFAYPLVICSFSLVIILFLLVVITPIFAKVYSQLGVTLPFPTMVLVFLSTAIRKLFLLWLGLIIGITSVLYHYRKKQWHLKIANFIMEKAPLLGALRQKIAIAKFVRAFGSLLSCHVNILTALHVVSTMIKQEKVQEMIQTIRTKIQGGTSVTKAFESTHAFSSMTLQMTHVGEEGGNLGPVMEKCAEGLEQDIDVISKRVLVVLEPLLTVGLSAIIGFIALAIYLPMFDLMGHVGK